MHWHRVRRKNTRSAGIVAPIERSNFVASWQITDVDGDFAEVIVNYRGDSVFHILNKLVAVLAATRVHFERKFARRTHRITPALWF